MTESWGRLRIDVVDDEIVVALPGTSYSVTYYKLPNSPQLLAKRIANEDDPQCPHGAVGISRSGLENCQRQGAGDGVDQITGKRQVLLSARRFSSGSRNMGSVTPSYFTRKAD